MKKVIAPDTQYDLHKKKRKTTDVFFLPTIKTQGIHNSETSFRTCE